MKKKRKLRPSEQEVSCKACPSATFTITRTTNLLAKKGADPTVFQVWCAECGLRWPH